MNTNAEEFKTVELVRQHFTAKPEKQDSSFSIRMSGCSGRLRIASFLLNRPEDKLQQYLAAAAGISYPACKHCDIRNALRHAQHRTCWFPLSCTWFEHLWRVKHPITCFLSWCHHTDMATLVKEKNTLLEQRLAWTIIFVKSQSPFLLIIFQGLFLNADQF